MASSAFKGGNGQKRGGGVGYEEGQEERGVCVRGQRRKRVGCCGGGWVRAGRGGGGGIISWAFVGNSF